MGWTRSPIRDVCGDAETETLKKAETVDDLEKSICRAVNFKSATASIRDLSKSVLEIVTKYKSENKDQTKWRENQELDFAVRNLAAAVTQAGRAQPPKSKSPLAKAMYDLTRKFGSWEQRKANEDGYLAALKKTMLMTKVGREVYACFSRNDGKNLLAGTLAEDPAHEIERNKPPPLGYGGEMTFVVYPNDETKLDGKWQKLLLFDWKSDPLTALQSIQHEFKHSCRAQEQLLCQKKAMKSKSLADAECDQESAVDELRAYKFDTQVFQELAKEAPELVCSVTILSESFGGIPVRMSDFQASYDEKIQEGRFIEHIIKFYVDIEKLSSEDSFFETDANGQKKLRPDFLKKIKDAGFNYPTSQP